jgi:hypothetical protein
MRLRVGDSMRAIGRCGEERHRIEVASGSDCEMSRSQIAKAILERGQCRGDTHLRHAMTFAIRVRRLMSGHSGFGSRAKPSSGFCAARCRFGAPGLMPRFGRGAIGCRVSDAADPLSMGSVLRPPVPQVNFTYANAGASPRRRAAATVNSRLAGVRNRDSGPPRELSHLDSRPLTEPESGEEAARRRAESKLVPGIPEC